MKAKQTILIILITLVTAIIVLMIYFKLTYKKSEDKPKDPVIKDPNINDDMFDYNIIHLVNTDKDNYLISPYSMAYALSILRDGASNNTKEQIDKVLNSYQIDKNNNVANHIGIANALFIKNKYGNDISKEYINSMKDKYSSEILFDKFEKPDIINNWVNKNTYGMINKILDSMDDDFVLGIANAIAIDVEWQNKFEPESTYKQDFTKLDNTTISVDMMHSSDDVTYFENGNAKGIIKKYKAYGNTELEFIGILPNNDINEYINTFNQNELNSLLENKKVPSDKLKIIYSLPKFKYDYSYLNFKKDLISLGITDAFSEDFADFGNMIDKNSDLRLYVNTAIHKTHIDLDENGTKAAAVTFFGLDKATALFEEKEEIKIDFNKPFFYIIKDKNSNNIWFFGTVYNPIQK